MSSKLNIDNDLIIVNQARKNGLLDRHSFNRIIQRINERYNNIKYTGISHNLFSGFTHNNICSINCQVCENHNSNTLL